MRPLVDGTPAFRRICEAIDAARQSVWVTVAFLWGDFEMPDGRGSAFDVLDRAAARGLDVRALLWRPDEHMSEYRQTTFWGSAHHRALLESRRSGVLIRWDRARPGFCQHQKSWLIDAGQDAETAFVGGINLNPHSAVSPGHRGAGQNHDIYVEITGPSAVDVHHNFVQRWNEASERADPQGLWGPGAHQDLPFPTRIAPRQGASVVQIQRTAPAGQYVNGQAVPGGQPFHIAAGERSILDQHLAAIGAARRSIYIENQHVEVPEVVACLRDALDRGVEVVLLVPGDPKGIVQSQAATDTSRAAFQEARHILGGYANLTWAGIAGLGDDGDRNPVHVHAKMMIVDDHWATIGSANLHRWSLFGNSEMNASFSDPDVVRALRVELFREHLAESTEGLDDRTAVRHFAQIAHENRLRWQRREGRWQGLAFSLDP